MKQESQLSLAAEQATCYEYVLRAIGQALEALDVRSFDIEVEGNNYIVQGRSETTQKPKVHKPATFKSILQNLRSLLQTPPAGNQSEKLSFPFAFLGLRFTPEDIDRLQRHGEALRSNLEGSPDHHRLSQILRLIGAYVDHKGGSLLRVSFHQQSATVCYRPLFGGEQTEVFTSSNLYDFWVHLYKQRT
ncbi:MAG TPA: hypothetical protein VFU31_10595 [Candidatus Binatia bacterium]|nr:hypothetical protein [Candidatus Binatia bacterium]